MYCITFVWPDQFTRQSLIDISIISAGCKSVATSRGFESVTICKEVWSNVIGEVLVCRRDTRTDRHDPQCCCYMQKDSIVSRARPFFLNEIERVWLARLRTVVGYVHVL